MNTYVALEEFTAAELEPDDKLKSTPLTWNLTFPPNINSNELYINVDHLTAFQKLVGISTSAVYEYQGEQTSFVPGVAGINADGSAIATRAGAVFKTETQKSQIEAHDSNLPQAYKTIRSEHMINKPEMASAISTDVVAGVQRETAWAKHLDLAVRSSLRSSARTHLLRGDPQVSRRSLQGEWFFTGMTGALLANSTEGFVEHQSVIGLYFYAGIYAVIGTIDAVNVMRNSEKSVVKDRRWSFFMGDIHPDRYALASMLSRKRGLIKHIAPSE